MESTLFVLSIFAKKVKCIVPLIYIKHQNNAYLRHYVLINPTSGYFSKIVTLVLQVSVQV